MNELQSVQMNVIQTMTSPNPFALIVSEAEARVNAMAVSWWTYVSNRPPMIAAALSQKSFSGETILQSNRFTLCLPSSDIAEAAFSCGCVSGRQTDKLKEFNLIPQPLVEGFPPALKGCGAAILCSVATTETTGDHILFIANAEHVFADPQARVLHAYAGYRELK